MRQPETPDPIRVAAQLIERHGLRAAAVAAEHVAEAQTAGDTVALDRWRQVQSAIVELRTSSRTAAEQQARMGV